MFSISSKHAANYVRPYIVPLSRRRLVAASSHRSNFSSSAEDESSTNLQEDDHNPSPDPDSTNTNNSNRYKRQSRKTLGVDSLGKPGEILVLPHTIRRQPKIIQKDTEDSNRPSAKEISLLIEKSKPTAAGTSYVSLLDEICSSYSPGDVLSKKEWTKIRNKIKQGFTVNQLNTYASRTSQTSHPLKEKSDPDTVDINESWQAGETPEETPLESSERSEKSQKNAVANMTKGKLADRILRDCWQLEMDDAVGGLDIRLPSQAIALLLSSDPSWIEELSHSLDAKIENFSSLNLIRVYGTRHACESVRDLLKSRCSSVHTQQMDLPFIHKLNTDKDGKTKFMFLRWLSKKHGILVKSKGRNTVASVSYFAENENKQIIPAQARRDLELANFITTAKTVPFCSYVPASTTGYMKFISHKRVEVLSKLDSLKHWTRWSIPTLSEDYVRDSAPPLFSKHSPNLSAEILQVLKEGASESHHPDVEETITASVGQTLFQRCTENDVTPLSASALGELSVPRIWHGWLPKAKSFVDNLQKFPGEMKFGNTHQFRMIPCEQNDHKLPVLEVKVSYRWTREDEGPPPLHEVRLGVKAIMEENSIDHLLPECNHDLRFTRTVTRDAFQGSGHDEHKKQLRRAILSSLEDVISEPGKPFPLTCEVPLPRSLLRDISAEGAQSSVDATEAGDDTIIGKYWFPSLQKFLGTMVNSFDFMGEKMSYSHIAGGPLGANKDDNINLQMVVTRETPLSSPPIPSNVQDGRANPAETALEQEFSSFYRTTCQLAFSLSQHSRKRKS